VSEATCSIEGCDRPTVGRGWCSMHWQRWKKHGDPGEATARRLFPAAEKKCRACGAIKRLDEFYLTTNKNRPHLGPRPMSRCKQCVSTSAQNWAQQNHERHLEVMRAYGKRSTRRRRLTKYGLTEAELTALEQAQAGRCAICREELGPALVIDHCHNSGQVRGLLCSACNVGLGSFRDDTARLHAAAAYLNRTSSRPHLVG
jgi:hypothetical protein